VQQSAISRIRRRLNSLYKRVTGLIAKTIVSAQHAKDADQKRYQQTMLQKLRAAEQACIHYRDLHCDAARHRYDGGSIGSMAWANCREETTEHRIDEWKHAFESEEIKPQHTHL